MNNVVSSEDDDVTEVLTVYWETTTWITLKMKSEKMKVGN